MWPLQRLILLMDEGADRYCSLQLVLEVGVFYDIIWLQRWLRRVFPYVYLICGVLGYGDNLETLAGRLPQYNRLLWNHRSKAVWDFQQRKQGHWGAVRNDCWRLCGRWEKGSKHFDGGGNQDWGKEHWGKARRKEERLLCFKLISWMLGNVDINK